MKREQSCAECHRRSQNSRKPKTKNPQGFPEGVNVRWKNLRHSRAADENHLAFDHANQNCLGSFHVQESRSGLGAGQLESDGSDQLSSLTPADVELLHRRFKQVDQQEGHQRGSVRKNMGIRSCWIICLRHPITVGERQHQKHRSSHARGAGTMLKNRQKTDSSEGCVRQRGRNVPFIRD